jgi:hypothetical protein
MFLCFIANRLFLSKQLLLVEANERNGLSEPESKVDDQDLMLPSKKDHVNQIASCMDSDSQSGLGSVTVTLEQSNNLPQIVCFLNEVIVEGRCPCGVGINCLVAPHGAGRLGIFNIVLFSNFLMFDYFDSQIFSRFVSFTDASKVTRSGFEM